MDLHLSLRFTHFSHCSLTPFLSGLFFEVLIKFVISPFFLKVWKMYSFMSLLTLSLFMCLSRVLREHLGEKEVQLSLTFDAVDEADLANYTCYVENHIGRRSGSAILQKKGRSLFLSLYFQQFLKQNQ